MRAQPGVGTEGELRGESGNVLVLREMKGGRVPILTVDRPFRIEIDDLTVPLADAVVAPRWLLQLSAPAGRTTSDEKLALRLARHLAEGGAGAVYDPQEDTVVWPRRRRRYRAASAEERIRVVNLEWFFPPSRSEALPAQWSERVERLLPEALPVRYGDFEPLQNRVETACLDGFRAFWRKQAEAPYGAHFFWKSTPPCYDGAVWLPDPRPPGSWWSPAAARHVSVKASFDGRALVGGRAWLAAVVTSSCGSRSLRAPRATTRRFAPSARRSRQPSSR